MLARLAIAAAMLAALSGLAACGDDDGSDVAGPDLSRIAYARAYQYGQFTVPGQTPESIGKALAELDPTWVLGLSRVRAHDTPSSAELEGFETIRDTVRAKSPDAEFGLELNALEYKTPDDVEDKMGELRDAYDIHGWFFDFFTPAYDKNPDVVNAAISDAHEHGEWIGGNTFGWSKDPSHPVVPPQSDYLAVSDDNFKLDLPAVRQLAEHVPIVFHFRNNPANPRSEGCIYIDKYTTAEREAYVTRRASEQAKYDFHFAYPVFFPTCFPQGKAHDVESFDAITDGSMLSTIERLMQKYN